VRNGDIEASATGEQAYWNFDRLLKIAQSRAGNTTSATGAIYAVRKDLIDPIEAGVTDDFFVSTGVIARGQRLVFASEAVAHEPVAPTGVVEMDRKVRVITRGLRAVAARRELLNPRQHGWYSVQLVSHKVLRRLMAFPLILLAAASPALWHRARLYRLVTVSQVVFYAGAVAALRRATAHSRFHRVLAVPSYFCLVNFACLRAVWNLVRGRRIDRWDPQRGFARR
jgi:hypothetical protein